MRHTAWIQTTGIWNRTFRCFHTTCIRANRAEKPEDNKIYTKTLLLPKTSFPLRPNPRQKEIPFQELTCENLYRWQSSNASGPLWVLHDGPPYANGNLHMGHALNKILKDIINRFHVLLGRRVHYIPGWDCHGLPIENKALQELGQDSTAPADLIREAAKKTAMREIENQKKQFRHFGIMADWGIQSTYRTLDRRYEIRQLRVFQKIVEKGLIYRHYRPVHYSPSSRSALAEAELVYKDDHVSESVYVAFEVDRTFSAAHPIIQDLMKSAQSIQLLVWTTTPWTLTANMESFSSSNAIAVHSDLTYAIIRSGDKYGIVAKERLEPLKEILGSPELVGHIQGSDLVGIRYQPIFGHTTSQVFSVIPASHVTCESGTGLVHCAPAHGTEDYQAFLALGLVSSSKPMICHVNQEGKFTPEVADVVGVSSANLVGLEVLSEGSKAVVDLLKRVGALVQTHPIAHRYPYDWKTDQPIIVTATSQWFADLTNIKDDALAALKKVTFYPPGSRNRLESFVKLRSEWCISRQRAWGVPIPALHHVDSDTVILDSASLDHIIPILDAKGIEHWWNGPVEDFIPPKLLEEGGSPHDWRKGTDTMDVWFDSGTSWAMLDEEGIGKDRRYLADVCLEGSDQHRGWFQSQLLTAVGSAPAGTRPVSPYKELITHGMVLDPMGKKMSKSLGNVVDPMTVVLGGKDQKLEPAYGADVLRLWVASVEFWRDMSIGSTALNQTAITLQKIRNTARFMLGNIGDQEARQKFQPVSKQDMGLVERYVMYELHHLEQTALDGYSSYNFPKVISALSKFANITLSSLYFAISKDCLYADALTSRERRIVVTVLTQALMTMTSVLAPVLPHLAEEIHQKLNPDGSSFFMTQWKPLDSEWVDTKAVEEMTELLRLRSLVSSLIEQARGHNGLGSSLEAEVDIILSENAAKTQFGELLQREENLLKTLFIVSNTFITDEGSLGTSSPEWLHVGTYPILGCNEDLAIRVRPATLQKCPRCWTYTREREDALCKRCASVLEQ